MALSPVPTRDKFTAPEGDNSGSGVAWTWLKYFQNLTAAVQAAITSVGISFQKTTAPATLTSNGLPNQIAYDENFLYVCTSKNVWKRIAWTP